MKAGPADQHRVQPAFGLSYVSVVARFAMLMSFSWVATDVGPALSYGAGLI